MSSMRSFLTEMPVSVLLEDSLATRLFGVRSTYKLRSETYFLDGPLSSICTNVVCLNFTRSVTISDQN